MKISKVSFDLPINKTITADFDKPTIFDTPDKPTNIKYVLTCTEEQKKNFNEAEFIKSLKDIENVNSVLVSYDIIKDTHVRSKKIIEAKTNKDKLIEYIRVNNLVSSEDLEEKLKDIEDSMEIKYIVPCHSFTLLKINLRGSTAIHEGLNKDEIEINFDDYPEGIIALTGRSGVGKSTLIENCHPYPKMLTRNGKLQDHFRLKDSHRILTYVDENNTYYEITIEIDGKSEKGKCKYFVKSGKDLSKLEPIEEVDGNSESYEKWVNNNFGSLELFLNTAYYANKKTGSIPDIATATKGDKKALFSSLIGIEGLSDISLLARTHAKNIKKNIELMESKIDELDPEDKGIREYEDDIFDYRKLYKLANDAEESIKKQLEEVKEKIVKVSDINDSAADIERELSVRKDDLEEYKQLLTMYKNIDINYVTNCISLHEAHNNLKEEYDKWTEEVYIPAEKAYNELYKEVTEAKSDYEIKKNKLECFVVTPINDTCPTCTQKLPELKIVELKKIYDDKLSKRKEYETECEEAKSNYDNLLFNLTNHQYLQLEETVKDFETKLASDIDNIPPLDTLTASKNLHEKYTEEGLKSDIDKVTKSISELERKLNLIKTSDINEYIKQKESFEHQIENLEKEKYDYSVKEGLAIAAIEQIKKRVETNNKYKELIKEANHNLAQYQLLDRAFGPDGITALELEAMSPDIAYMTNNILSESYGDKFKVTFKTLRQGSDGHYIEDFSILVTDTKTGTERPLEWLSGGESVWIKEALYYAFSVIRSKSTNFSMNTKFLDESDGALDSESRVKYLNMIKAAHKEGGVKHTILITHSQELKNIIEHQINF